MACLSKLQDQSEPIWDGSQDAPHVKNSDILMLEIDLVPWNALESVYE
jgi:hypothetical protein